SIGASSSETGSAVSAEGSGFRGANTGPTNGMPRRFIVRGGVHIVYLPSSSPVVVSGFLRSFSGALCSFSGGLLCLRPAGKRNNDIIVRICLCGSFDDALPFHDAARLAAKPELLP